MDFTSVDLQRLLDRLPTLPEGEQREILKLLEEYRSTTDKERARQRFIHYVSYVWPDFIGGNHHRIVADAFDRIVEGELKRLIINMAPRHTKSEFASWLLPARYLGRWPNRKVIQCSNTAELASGFGRRARNLINDDHRYHELYPGIELAADSKAAAHWHTNRGGEYFAIGVHGKVTGKGADLLVIDDPHSEQEAKDAEAKPEIFDDVYNWYTSGPRQRLQPSAAIVIVMTRWSKRDLTGRLLTKMANGTGDNFEIITLPAILDENPHEPENERLMWPGYWTLKEMQATRTAIPVSKWQAQYQQNPTSEEGAIIKRDDWRRWPRRSPPACDYILQSWDTAFTTHTRSNYSACTTWGVFEHQEPDEPYPVTNLILLDAYRARMEFPQLKRKVQEFYDHWEPDSLLIEAKGSGASLVQELRWMGMPVAESKPVRGGRQQSNDKISRANAVSDVFASGFVWAPEARWAEEVIEECAAFPHGEDDDYVDTVTQALLRFREGGLIRTRLDLDDDDFTRAPVPQEAYY
jgi:predicted phage terminase large subunit-like protein